MSLEAMDKPRDQTPQLKNQSDWDNRGLVDYSICICTCKAYYRAQWVTIKTALLQDWLITLQSWMDFRSKSYQRNSV